MVHKFGLVLYLGAGVHIVVALTIAVVLQLPNFKPLYELRF